MPVTVTLASTWSPGLTGARNFSVCPRYTVPCPGYCSPITAEISAAVSIPCAIRPSKMVSRA